MASSVNSLASPKMIPKTSRSFCRRKHAHWQCQDSDFAADQYVNIGYNPLLSTLPSRQQTDVRLTCHQHPIVLHVGRAVPSISIPPWAGGGVHHPIPLAAAAASFNILAPSKIPLNCKASSLEATLSPRWSGSPPVQGIFQTHVLSLPAFRFSSQ